VPTTAASAAIAEGIAPHVPREPREVIEAVLRRFPIDSIVMTTSFGMEGAAIVELLDQARLYPRVAWIDTDFLFPETYELQRRMQDRYPRFAFERFSPLLTPEAQAREHGDALWARDPDRCCAIRKVEPLSRVLSHASVWVVALRRSQSATRATIDHASWDWHHRVLKVAPIADWSRAQVWEFLRAHNVPYNPLHERGYPSIGCTHCTKAVPGAGPGDYSREGRWQGTGKTECGLHADYFKAPRPPPS
jgi:phosphoadenosine phosphosulfate reductase